MTIAPTEPASDAEVGQPAVATPGVPAGRAGAGEDGPGVALLRTLTELTEDLTATDPGKVAAAALRGRHPGSDEAELRSLAIDAAAGLIGDEPQYSKLAARLLTRAIAEEAAGQGAVSFSASVETGHREGLIADATATFVRTHAARLDALVGRALADGADDRFGYFGLRTLHSRYLLRHPTTRQVIETPQHFLLRVACGLAENDSVAALDDV
ncbi:ribonucleotide reductase N-terminal alpha domain-containing protein, partial [Streptomyces kasugaensis]|uniref:ribonucleotide reductase N-terminal alpha domain-containing protein n=1 Tax=Streptomyces kasugaensis TaxID=1946 RepID=UPI003BF7A074